MRTIRFRRRHPLFTVVIATFNRDELIAPTLESVRNQTLSNFEVLIVSDGPAGQGLKGVVQQFDSRFRLLECEQRSRSQSGPNNLGWNSARGRYVAYLGHDDIWRSDHLQCLADVFASHSKIDFAVSGCLFLGPPGSGDDLTWVTGFFENDDRDAPRVNFFPPSSFSHRRQLPSEVQRWSDPAVTSRPVDTEFLLGAVGNGCVFASTGRVTVFKFASALRYLSYHCPENEEQQGMLRLLDDDEALEVFVRERVDASRVKGGYLAPRHAEPEQFLPGEILQLHERTRGISLPPMERVGEGKDLAVGDDYRAFDWHGIERAENTTWRWSGPNHRPRLLLPFSHDEKVKVTLRVLRFAMPDIEESLRVRLDGDEVDTTTDTVDDVHHISFVSQLRQDSPSVVEFRMNRTASASEIDPGSLDQRRLGLCLLGVTVAPASLGQCGNISN